MLRPLTRSLTTVSAPRSTLPLTTLQLHLQTTYRAFKRDRRLLNAPPPALSPPTWWPLVADLPESADLPREDARRLVHLCLHTAWHDADVAKARTEVICARFGGKLDAGDVRSLVGSWARGVRARSRWVYGDRGGGHNHDDDAGWFAHPGYGCSSADVMVGDARGAGVKTLVERVGVGEGQETLMGLAMVLLQCGIRPTLDVWSGGDEVVAGAIRGRMEVGDLEGATRAACGALAQLSGREMECCAGAIEEIHRLVYRLCEKRRDVLAGRVIASSAELGLSIPPDTVAASVRGVRSKGRGLVLEVLTRVSNETMGQTSTGLARRMDAVDKSRPGAARRLVEMDDEIHLPRNGGENRATATCNALMRNVVQCDGGMALAEALLTAMEDGDPDPFLRAVNVLPITETDRGGQDSDAFSSSFIPRADPAKWFNMFDRLRRGRPSDLKPTNITSTPKQRTFPSPDATTYSLVMRGHREQDSPGRCCGTFQRMKGLALVEPDASCLALNVAALCDRGMLTEAVQALKEMRRLPGIDRDLIRRLGAGVDVLC